MLTDGLRAAGEPQHFAQNLTINQAGSGQELLPRKKSARSAYELLSRRRRSILDAGHKLAVDQQSTEFGLDAVADAAHLPLSTVAVIFSSVEQLLVESAVDLARLEILPQYLEMEPPVSGPATSAFAQHFFRHRDFYIVMQSSALSSALNAALDELFVYFNALNVSAAVGPTTNSARIEKIARDVTDLARTTVRTWLFDEGETPTAEGLYLMLESIMLKKFGERESGETAHQLDSSPS